MQVLYNCCLLDTLCSRSQRIIIPDVMTSYLKHRVRQEPSKGNPSLNLFRRLVNDLHKDMDLNDPGLSKSDDCLHRLCSVAMSGRNRREHFVKIFIKGGYDVDAAGYRSKLFCAALCTSNLPIVQQCIAVDASLLAQFGCANRDDLFGSQIELAAEYGNLKLITYFLTSRVSGEDKHVRRLLFHDAALAGRLEIVKYIYNFKRMELPWNFEDRKSKEAMMLTRVFRTRFIGVMKFVEELRTAHCLPPIEFNDVQEAYSASGRTGAHEVAVYLLPRGVWVDGMRHLFGNPLLTACAWPYASIAMIDFFLDNGARAEEAISAAAGRGHTEKVSHMLGRGIKPVEALRGAAAGPYLDIVRLLLDAGVDPNESTGPLSPLVGAISTEHTELFKFLIERGADLSTPGTSEECVKVAKKDGLESMLKLLEEYGVDVDSYPVVKKEAQV